MEQYVEMTVEEALKRCNKNAKVLVAVQNLEKSDVNIPFVAIRKNEYDRLFENIQTAVQIYDDLVEQLRLFTEKQDINNIRPYGFEKIVLLKEWKWENLANKCSGKYWQKQTYVLYFGYKTKRPN